MTYVEYKQLNPFQRFAHDFKKFLVSIPKAVANFFKAFGRAIVGFFVGIGKGFANYGTTFVKGDWATKLSYLIFGFGDIHKGKYYKGILFFLAEVLYILYMVFFGWTYLSKFTTLGTVETHEVPYGIDTKTVLGDNSMLILLYSVLSIVITIVVFVAYIANIKDAYRHQIMRAEGKKPTGLKYDVQQFLDGKYHITLLSFPTLMIGIFNILPLIFMILIAFTNYDAKHMPPGTLFTWVGLKNFGQLFDVVNSARRAHTFFSLTKWTLLWAVVATFSNYILGMVFALMINKKGIKLKSLWRTLFVITIAVPQFVSLLLMNQMLSIDGAFNVILEKIAGHEVAYNFFGTATSARLTVIIVNCWVGIPYTILSMSGILMNIPEDLYESARIDGAGPVKTFTAITLPYMLFVTTPQLITQFVGNINNFNVIYLLSAGDPPNPDLYVAGDTDILVTWLFKLTMGSTKDYGLSAAIGIVVFIVCATLSLIVYNNSKSMKDEEAFS